MIIKEEIQSLSPSAIVELFVLDATNLDGGEISYFHAGTNKLCAPVWWQGNEYTPMPVEGEGFDLTAKGDLPKPKIRIANVNGLFSAAVRESDDLINCRVIRKRTFAKYLDAKNFPSGTNPDADPNQHLPDQVWFIDRKVTENKYMIEWELASAFDVQGVQLPFRQVIQNSCSWKYRGPECGYTQPYYFTKDDVWTTDPNEDFCAKRLSSCQCRHQNGITVPFGGFPGAFRVDQ